MPEQVVGTCPWCERENVNLYIVTGYNRHDGAIAQYVCYRCIDSMNIVQATRERRDAQCQIWKR